MTAAILDELVANVRPGVPTMLFEDIAQAMCRDFGVRPSFQGYGGFPYALCCSVNETVVHGFPSKERIRRRKGILSVSTWESSIRASTATRRVPFWWVKCPEAAEASLPG